MIGLNLDLPFTILIIDTTSQTNIINSKVRHHLAPLSIYSKLELNCRADVYLGRKIMILLYSSDNLARADWRHGQGDMLPDII